MNRTRVAAAVAAAVWIGSAGVASAEARAAARLNDSPRHHEWVNVPAGKRSVRSFVVYPEKESPTAAVIVIHENRGLTDWVRSFADQVAEAGYLAIAPDFLSGFSEDRAHTGDFPTSDDARTAIYELDGGQVMADLKAARDYVAALPASNGTVAVAGFCWGGAKSFEFATREKDLAAVLTFYGSPVKEPKAIQRIAAPVYGFYGGEDARINAQIPETEKLMKRHGKPYDVVIYDGAGHAFMKHGDDPSGSAANKAARDRAWERIKTSLAGLKK